MKKRPGQGGPARRAPKPTDVIRISERGRELLALAELAPLMQAARRALRIAERLRLEQRERERAS